MLKRVNFKSLHDDLRKVGVTVLIGGITGLLLGSHNKIIPLSILSVLGLLLWYLGLSDGDINDRN